MARYIVTMSDVIPVRSEERFDETAVAIFLEDRLEGAAGPMVVEQFGGGRANLTYLLRFANGAEFVLRRPPLGPVAPGSHDMEREYSVLSRLWQAFDKAPRAYVFSGDDSVIGAPFFVMERRGGVVVRDSVPARFGAGRDPVATRALSEVVIATLAEFHAVDPADCGLQDLGHPEGFLERQVDGWRKRWDRAKHEQNPVAEEVGIWLHENLPNQLQPTLLHNDWRLDNMAVADDDPGRCVAVYDWDMATRGDPLVDLGTLLGSWHDPNEESDDVHTLMPVSSPGWMVRAEAIDLYARTSGKDLDGIDWYVVFGTWKLGVVLEQIYIRWLRGQTSDSRFSSMGAGAARLFELAAARRG